MNRRTLLAGAASAAIVAANWPAIRLAQASETRRLAIATRVLEVNGKAAKVFGLTGPDGKPGLSFEAGGNFDIRLDNQLAEETMIHWHGLTPPAEYDGVPDLPMPIIKAGEQRNFRFPIGNGGTHWMHAHTLQEQQLLAAPLIVRTADDLKADEQEVVILLHDFSFTPPAELLAQLKAGKSSSGNMDANAMNHGGGTMNGMDMPRMDMSGGMAGMDLNDVNYDAYLANDRTLDDPEVVKVEKGGRVRLRIINGATATAFTIDLDSLGGSLIAVDGQPIVPVSGSQFPLSMGQRADIRLDLPKEGGAFPVLALREGGNERTGVVLASSGAPVSRLAVVGDAAGPILDLSLEATLQALQPLSQKPADKNFMVHLSGNMDGYTWAMGGDHLNIRPRSRLAITMMNMSMMAHPMHLHGHHFQVVAIGGKSISGAVRDTVLVPPNQTVTFAFEAVNPAKAWAFHCHHLYHMASGMMTTVNYEGA
ncbi:MAG: multicopper oxidase domain-containing protein [Hyphomicrobiales bacterium]|nr:multicopper oxidase domain-containing protein [Hyphomicrobiales bacterium]